MATLASWGVDTLYEKGYDYQSGDIKTGAETISFVKALNKGESRPRMYSFKTGAAAVADDTTITLGLIDYADFNDAVSTVATGSIVLRKGDVLDFGVADDPYVPNPVVIAKDVVIPAVTTLTATVNVEVLPLLAPIAINAEAYSYALLPVQFVETGGMFDNSADIATAQNKSVGYWSLKAITGRNATVTLSGSMIVQDSSMYEFNAVNEGGRFLYYEIRFHPYSNFSYLDSEGNTQTVLYGSGPQAKVGTCTSSFKMMADKTDLIKCEASMESAGRPIDYVMLSINSEEVTKFTWTNTDLI